MENIAEYYKLNLNLLQPILKLTNLYIIFTNQDKRVNNSQIYRVEHRKRTVIKINFEEIREDYVNEYWKLRYSAKNLPKKFNTLDHALFILLHEIMHYIRKDHLTNWNILSEGELICKENECDIQAVKYLQLLKLLTK
jgi:hypothetical protein